MRRRKPGLCPLNILSYHQFTLICFNLGLRFLLTFAPNTRRIRVFRLANGPAVRCLIRLLVVDGGMNPSSAGNESNFLPV